MRKNLFIHKTFLLFFAICIGTFASAYKRPDVYTIDAAKNATIHNNMGLRYVDEKWYPAAAEEFKIAISLNPNTQATSVYYLNLGDTYMKMGYFQWANDCYERAIKQYSLNFLYYQNLVKSFKAMNVLSEKINYYEKNSTKPTDMVILGLLYVESGNVSRGIIKLDEFCMQEPDLIITAAVRNYLKELVKAVR